MVGGEVGQRLVQFSSGAVSCYAARPTKMSLVRTKRGGGAYADALSLEPSGDINDELEGENLSHEDWKPFFSRFGALPFNYYG